MPPKSIGGPIAAPRSIAVWKVASWSIPGAVPSELQSDATEIGEPVVPSTIAMKSCPPIVRIPIGLSAKEVFKPKSKTSEVPPCVPSVFQRAQPVPSLATKYALAPIAAKCGPSVVLMPELVPVRTSASRTVPGPVPSLIQGSLPVLPSLAKKIRELPNGASWLGFEEAEAGLRLATRTVPGPDPSLFQSSVPLVPSLARKKRVEPTAVSCAGLELEAPGRMSLTSPVPGPVPSLFQSSVPSAPLVAVK